MYKTHQLTTMPPTTTSNIDLTTSQGLQTFPLFSLLPSELRAKIWHLTYSPRVVSIAYNPESRRCVSPTPPPIALSINREARYETLRFYAPWFATSNARAAGIPFNASLDTLYFPRHRAMGYDDTLRDFRTFLANPSELDGVKRLALDSVDIGVKRPWESYDKAVLIKSVPNVDSLFLVVRLEWLTNSATLRPPAGSGRRAISFTPCVDVKAAKRAAEDFGEGFAREEQVLEQYAAMEGQAYAVWKLPPIVVVEKELAK